MIRSITQPKKEETRDRLLQDFNRLFIIGCGTCVTLTRTGGAPEVAAMAEELAGRGKLITGQTVVPVACDHLTHEFLKEYGAQIDQADALLIMTCAFGVQTIARQLEKNVIPALDSVRHLHYWRNRRYLSGHKLPQRPGQWPLRRDQPRQV